MSLSDYIPEIFGSAPTGYQGLLGEEQTKALQKQANLQGLLGVASGLAQGMSSQGPRRSALQNILGSLAGGFGATQQAYQQGLQSFGQQQQMAQAQLANKQAAELRASVEQVMKMPEVANNPALVAALRADPINTLKLINENQAAAATYGPVTSTPAVSQYAQAAPMSPVDQSKLLTGEIQTIGEKQLPLISEVTPTKSQVDQQIEAISRSNQAALRMGGESGKRIIDKNKIVMEDLLKQKARESVASYDFTDLEKSVSPELKPAVTQLKALKADGLLSTEQLQKAIENIQNKNIDILKTNQFANETAKDYAMSTFGTNDITKLSQAQRNNVLSFVNAPSARDQATIANDAIRLKQETGQAGVVPVGRSQFLGGGKPVLGTGQIGAGKPVSEPSQVPETATPTVPKQAAIVPLIEKPDSMVPPAQKQKLTLAQPGTIALVSYSLDNISQQKKAAEDLLNNPTYIKALTAKGLLSGMATSKLVEQPGTDAYNAYQLMKNLQTRAFVSEIQKMRTASPTGGAVGNVTEKEMEGLSNIGAALKIGLSEKEFITQLKKYISNADRALKTIPTEYSRTYRYGGEFDQYLGGGLPPGVKVEVVK